MEEIGFSTRILAAPDIIKLTLKEFEDLKREGVPYPYGSGVGYAQSNFPDTDGGVGPEKEGVENWNIYDYIPPGG